MNNITNASNTLAPAKIIIRTKKPKTPKTKRNDGTLYDSPLHKKQPVFNTQITRNDVLMNMVANCNLTGTELFNLLMKENTDNMNERREGWIFETICQIVITLKCLAGIHYTDIYSGQLQNMKPVKNVNEIFSVNVEGGGNNIVDFIVKNENTFILFSVKHHKKYGETDVSKIDNTVAKMENPDNQQYKIALIVKNKDFITNHKYKNDQNIDKQLHDIIVGNRLLFDENDIITALDVFCGRFRGMAKCFIKCVDVVDFINAEYLFSPRQSLTVKLHQQMTLLKFTKSLTDKNNQHRNKWCIAHKPRSGKSITILLICKHLLENGHDKILIMTSVPSTIHSFIADLNKYLDFRGIKYNTQEFVNETSHQIDGNENNQRGITFCSVQYLKADKQNKKKEFLQRAGFSVIVTDESHLGSSTDKTKTDILEVDGVIDELRKNIKLNIFASGTADKTRKYYNISSSHVFEWEMEDEAHMKEITTTTATTTATDAMKFMTTRHGLVFTECMENTTLNRDYSKHPTQVLMKHSIPNNVISNIEKYNETYQTKYGYSCSSIFALKQTINERGEVEYSDEFELCNHNDGIELLIGFFECIISKNMMNKNTIMQHIENTQSVCNSRKSTRETPRLFIMYLPTHTRNGTISLLQRAIKRFLEEHDLWGNYNIEYSNSTEDTGSVKEEYDEFVRTIMNRTRTLRKRGCILLLGNKGGVGVTYHDCDVTISLDDGHNLDNQKQRYSRALTEAEGKTVGINVDMNIQRTYLYLADVVQKHRRHNRHDAKTNAEIMHYLYEHNVFLFDPQQFNYGKVTMAEIKNYYCAEAENMMNQLDDSYLLDDLVCDDDMRNFIKGDFKKMMVTVTAKQHNEALDGEQPNCPKGDTTAILVNTTPTPAPVATTEAEEEKKTEVIINQTLEMCKSFLFPLLALLSRSYRIFDFKDIFIHEKTAVLIMNLLCDKKIDLNLHNKIMIVNIMNAIIENNAEIVNHIREIYEIAPAHKLRTLIEKHFIPTADEKKKNAEVPTPVVLVEEMLDKMPTEFWKKPQTVFEPCCGKGNFVLGIFDRFYKGLEDVIEDEIERCRVIVSECIYYADLTALNVFITTELLKCHVQSYCGLDELTEENGFVFHGHVGDTLKLDVTEKWGVEGFNAVIGNPPYNASGNTSTGNTIWQEFTKISLNKWLITDGYLCMVHPPGWRKPNTEKGRFTRLFDLMTKENQMLYLEIHGIKDGQKIFNCGTKYDWYIVQKQPCCKNTIVVDENRIILELNANDFNWLPNSNIMEIQKIIAKEKDEKCHVIYSPSLYEHRKIWMSHLKTDEFKYPCVHSTPKTGVRYMFSKLNNKGHFGTSKIIFGEAGINDIVIDINGEYGLTNGAIGIEITSVMDGEKYKMALQSVKFDNILKSCMFSSYRVDWNLFKEFKKDFWKEFV